MSGRGYQVLGLVGRQTGPPKASNAHGGMTGVAFYLGKVVWSVERGDDSIMGVETDA